MKTASVMLATAALCQLLLITPSSAGSAERVGSGLSGDRGEIVGGLPLPFGVSVYYLWQQGDYEVTDLRAFLPGGFPVPGLGANAITNIQNDIDEVNAKFDWWALPWLNFHAIIGRVSGHADADLAPALTSMLGASQFKVDYDGLVYGGGMTLAVGYKSFFGSITANYSWADVNMKDGPGLSLDDPNGIETLVITPKIGWRFEQGAVWAGAYYQFTEHTQSGTFNLAGLGAVNFQADVEDKSPWNFIAGGEYKLTDHWILTAEAGFGKREQVLVGTTYRF